MNGEWCALHVQVSGSQAERCLLTSTFLKEEREMGGREESDRLGEGKEREEGGWEGGGENRKESRTLGICTICCLILYTY